MHATNQTHLEHYRRYHADEANAKTVRLIATILAAVAGLALFIALIGAMAFGNDADAHNDTNTQLTAVGAQQLRHCESTSNYASVHLDVDGQYVYGAYQFKDATWQATIDGMTAGNYRGQDWSEWRNVTANNAPSHIQDAAAAYLWAIDPHHWRNCHNSVIAAMNSTRPADPPPAPPLVLEAPTPPLAHTG